MSEQAEYVQSLAGGLDPKYLTSGSYGTLWVGTEGNAKRTAEVWHEEALIEELGIRAWGYLTREENGPKDFRIDAILGRKEA